MLSGLEGKALAASWADDVPTKGQVRAVVPKHCYKRDTWRSLSCLFQSGALTALASVTGLLIPLKAAFLPVWVAYAGVTGTVAMGLWVLAHECGHGAFSDNRFRELGLKPRAMRRSGRSRGRWRASALPDRVWRSAFAVQDAVGYALHSLLLVPYFSWQRSHAVHHAHTNHITEGETHVPTVVDGMDGEENTGEFDLAIARGMGIRRHGVLQLLLHLFVGWPAYLMFGATGGPKHGLTNHFIPVAPFSKALWPNRWPRKVWLSDLGVFGMLSLLAAWISKAGFAHMMAFYGGPLLVVNCWLIIYTWLQHTDVDVPHLAKSEFSYMRGAFLTLDRPYGRLFDYLHHRIGSTHVAHHIDCTIPHYHAREATDAIAKAFPKVYLYDPTPVHKALWRVACKCVAVKKSAALGGRYIWVDPTLPA